MIADEAAWRTINNAPAPDLPELRQPWRHGWRSNERELSRLYHATRHIMPSVVVETGTLAAHGTLSIAKAMEDAGKGGTIYTIDYDGDPVQDAKSNSGITQDDWRTLRENREANLKTVQAAAPSVSVKFIEGDSRKVLPPLLDQIEAWDLWFQDSMHYKSGIQEELALLAPKAAPDAVAIFDNVDRVHPFGRWYIKQLGDHAAHRSLTQERTRQLWVHAKGGLPT